MIYSRQFGICYLDDEGTNYYADLKVKPSEDVEFVQWRDGGHSHTITVDNRTIDNIFTNPLPVYSSAHTPTSS